MMKFVLISLSLICAVIWTVDAIECQKCFQKNSDTCVGESVHCPNATQCMVVSELYQIGNETMHLIKKDCNPDLPCGEIYFSNFKDTHVKTNIQCCSEDNCNTDCYKMPPEDIERKGKICPACFQDGLTECISNNTERCIHPGDLCLEYIGRVKGPDNNIRNYTYKGCISPLGCTYKWNAFFGAEEVETIRLTCV
ncbi:phospholipase A2 inhibitor and Ly6/PLAUR domain-containing protein-like [Mixophyes fleayi]|uniref:phospholipase A2 inhibitor and Ly6/PLAUR domain-containing protein-like n=1 Tax=Mixophyes fleayi TaxID=3061075 RepID=UPI003F4E07E6